MKQKKQKKRLRAASPIVTVALFAVAVAMLLGGSIGGTRAALTQDSALFGPGPLILDPVRPQVHQVQVDQVRGKVAHLHAIVEVEVDAVQEHNAEDAVWSAWGKRISVGEDGILSLVE